MFMVAVILQVLYVSGAGPWLNWMHPNSVPLSHMFRFSIPDCV